MIEGAIKGVAKRVGQETIYSVEELVNQDEEKDLAILRVTAPDVEPLYFGESDSVKVGQAIYVAGNPEGILEGTFSDGIISAIRGDSANRLLQLTAPISEGSSGGPVLNDRGGVVGVSVATWKHGQNLNFAIPSKYLITLMINSGIRPPRRPKPKSNNAKTARGKAERAKTERAKAEAEKARADVEKAKAEAERAKADARKVEAEAKKAEAEARKMEAERAKAELKIAEAERTETEAESAKKGEVKIPQTEASITDRLQAATVHIYGTDRNGNEGRLGSGFFVRKDQVATDFHVVDGSTLKGVKPIGQVAQSVNALLAAKVFKTKKARHLAILQVETADFHPLIIGNSEKIEKGGEIRVFSDPAVPKGKFSKGIISGSPYIDGVRFFQFDAPVSPGSSGGPIVNRSGEVIAIISLKVPEFYGSLRYAIPSNYLNDLIEGEGDPSPQPSKELEIVPTPEHLPKVMSPSPHLHERLLQSGIDLYEKSRFNESIESLESALNGVRDPEMRAKTHLYLAFSKWGLAETESSVTGDFREALRYNPDIKLPPRIGQNHPVFNPLLELARRKSIGTLSINASPPETEIKIHGGEIAPELPDGETVNLRLFKGNYAVEGILGHVHRVVPVLINPSDHVEISLVMPTDAATSREFELTLDLFSAEKPKEVKVYYTSYDANGKQLDQSVKGMQFREHKPEASIWVYHVKLPSAAQGGKIVYRIEADGKVIRDDPMQVEILEPPENASIAANQTIPIKARIISNVAVRAVRVFYNAPGALSDSSPSKELKSVSDSNTYIGEIPVQRKDTDGVTWFYVSATTGEEDKTTRSATRAVHDKMADKRVDGKKAPEDLPSPPLPPEHRGAWASHSWSSVPKNGRFNSDWERGDVASIAYLGEGKGLQTLGARLDFAYENSTNTSAVVQWGPALRDSHIAFAILAGVAGYRSSEPSFSRARQSTEITPLLGGSLKFYPLDRVVVDLTGSIKLRSANSGGRESSFTEEYFHHYEMGIRLYITPSINLKAGYGRWRLGEYDNTSVQLGLGNTF